MVKRISSVLMMLMAFLLIASSVGATTPTELNLPLCDESLRGGGGHGDNCDDNNSIGGCNGIISDVVSASVSIPTDQPICGDHRVPGCDRVTDLGNGYFQQFYCSTVPIWLVIDGIPTLVAPGVGIPTLWHNVQSCPMSLLPGQGCDPNGDGWNIPNANPGDGTQPAFAQHQALCACKPLLCGDGLVQPWEFCDDGNLIDGDTCSSQCTLDRQITHPCKHACLSRITANDSPKLDKFELHGRILPATAINPAAEDFSIALSNANGDLFNFTLPPGAFTQAGTKYRYQNLLARVNGGVFKITITPRPDLPGSYRVDAYVYADANPSLSVMKLTIVVGDDIFSVQKPWTVTSKGFQTQFN